MSLGSSPDGTTERDAPAAATIPTVGRLIAIDWGERRIGLAVSEPSQTIAHPLGTLTRRAGRRFPLKRLRHHLEEQKPVGVVIGLPLDENGHEGAGAEAAREVGSLIAEKTHLPVTFWDERMSTARVLGSIRELHGSTRSPKRDVDELAATVILQGYLDSRRS